MSVVRLLAALLLGLNTGRHAFALPAGSDDGGLPAVVVGAARSDPVSLPGEGGVVDAARIGMLPSLRPGGLLESVPGLMVTQHAGDGKANQYFLRGFNLDHGTDFATRVLDVPVNLPTHAHGQGYTDLNFLIPELVDTVRWRKGPYFVEDGDFASAGAARIDYLRRLPATFAQFGTGSNGYARALIAGSPPLGDGHLLHAFEALVHDGPWQVPQAHRKFNAVLRYSEGTADDGIALSALAYRASWRSTDQVPARAIAQGLLDRFGSLDDTSGGSTHRHSLSGQWAGRIDGAQWRFGGWWLETGLDLWSNFHYCMADIAATDSCQRGDQFQQIERRRALGFSVSRAASFDWHGHEAADRAGLEARIDRIGPLALRASSGRVAWASLREDLVRQRSLGAWVEREVLWTAWLRTVAGLRADLYGFDVASGLIENAGRAGDALVSPRLRTGFGPWNGLGGFLHVGSGFHSNDARGTTIRVDPADPSVSVARVAPLVRTRGVDLGLEWSPGPSWRSKLTVWRLDLDSELLFVGDAGVTAALGASTRRGIEWHQSVRLARGVELDADLSWSRARFRSAPAGEDQVPGAIGTTASVAVSYGAGGPWTAALQLRWVGPRPLVENGSVRSAGALLANLRATVRSDARTRVIIDLLNLADRRVDDISYWYASQLAGEAAPVFDRHLHPAEPRAIRLTLERRL